MNAVSSVEVNKLVGIFAVNYIYRNDPRILPCGTPAEITFRKETTALDLIP